MIPFWIVKMRPSILWIIYAKAMASSIVSNVNLFGPATFFRNRKFINQAWLTIPPPPFSGSPSASSTPIFSIGLMSKILSFLLNELFSTTTHSDTVIEITERFPLYYQYVKSHLSVHSDAGGILPRRALLAENAMLRTKIPPVHDDEREVRHHQFTLLL